MSEDKAEPQKQRKNRKAVGVGCVGLLLVASALGVTAFYLLTALPPLEPDARVLPNPNGFDAVKAVVRGLTPTSGDSPILSKSASAGSLRKELKADLPALDRLHVALQMPYMTPALSYEQAFADPTNGIGAALREGARKLVGKSRMLAAEGHPDRAMECLLDAVAIGIKAGRGGTLIDVLVGNACIALAANDAFPLIEPQSPAALRRHRKRLEGILTETAGEKEALTEERRVSRMLSGRFGENHPFSRLMNRQIDQVYKEALAETVKPSAERRPPASAGSLYGSLVATVIPDFRKSLDKRDRLLATLRVKMAVEEYRKTHHRLPQTLDDLIPDIIAEPPLDPPTRKPLKYRLLGDSFEIASP